MKRSKRQKTVSQPQKRSSGGWIILAVIVVAAGGALFFKASKKSAKITPSTPPAVTTVAMPAAPAERPDAEVVAAYAGSASCKDCHAAEFAMWKGSHHGLAERPLDPARDKIAFEPARTIKHGTQTTEARSDKGVFEVVTKGVDGERKTFAAERVIGVDPLEQYLIKADGGRLQVLELAFDPNKHDWFDIFGTEDRMPGEWGHWTGRGMTWNTMCATCHNTRLRKHYDAATDSYHTTMVEMGVSCESCHGPMASHVTWQKKNPHSGIKDPTVKKLSRDQMTAACGSCHSRRAELTGEFEPGDNYFDHFTLTIPDDTDVFYPDGQVHDEDYEFTSFLSSKMHAAGVRCMDCHQPHTAKIILPGNDLCLRCHGAPIPPAPKIDPATHSHHRLDQAGGRCVECHMPQTTYMQRHARRDHGFTIPDPLLTKEQGIPNACNRCHQDRKTEWALEAVEKWYGKKMERSTRTRARWVADARVGKTGAQTNLVTMLQTETNMLWRAVAANLLKRWAEDPAVTPALVRATADYHPMVRAMSARSLESVANNNVHGVDAVLKNMLKDSVRCARVEAGWSLRTSLDVNSQAAKDVMRYLEFNRDEPSGLMQLGAWNMERRDTKAALDCFEQAVKWDRGSAPLRQSLAVAYSMTGQTERAVSELEMACRLAPRDAEYRYKLGLAYNEAGRLNDATTALAEATKIDPQFAQAWYNLGLAYSAQDQPAKALETLQRAEQLSPGAAQVPYARATIYARMGKTVEAREAATKALKIQPDYTDAANLLRTLSE